MLSSMALNITVLLSNNTSLLCSSTLLNLLRCLLRTIIRTTPLKHTNRSNHSMVRNSPHNSSKLQLLNLHMDTVCPLINPLMADHHNSGVLRRIDLLSMQMQIVVVVAFLMPEAVMKHLSWVPLYVWALVTIEEVVTWLKRAVASPNSIQPIKLHLLLSLSHRIKVINHQRTFMGADNVHLLIPIRSTLALIEAREGT